MQAIKIQNIIPKTIVMQIIIKQCMMTKSCHATLLYYNKSNTMHRLEG